jgi:putative ABC transport system permease protein
MSASRGLSLATAAKIAWRDLAASRSKFLFIVFAIAVGVGSLAGVRGFGRAFRTMLVAEARTLMAADLSVRVFELPNPEQIAVMDSLVERGARRTQITETISMVSFGDANPVLVSLKAVDPAQYPYYGEVKLDPPLALSEALTPDTIAVGDDLLIRLPLLKIGDRVQLGEGDFRITAIIRGEPDRMAGSLNVGPRILLSRAALERTDLVKAGSRSANRHLFRLPVQTLPIEATRAELKKVFPTALIADFRETHPLITRGLNRSERFLSLVSLIALIVGGLGVAATMRAHLEQRLDSIAIMKCIGGRSGQIARIYLLQTALVGLAGGLLGALLGTLVQAAFPPLIEQYFAITPPLRFDLLAAAEALTIGLLTAMLFTWPTLVAVRHIRPAVIFRRDMAGSAKPSRWDGRVWLARGAILLAIAGIAAWLAGGDRLRVGGFFAGGLLVSLLLLTGFAWLLLRALRLFLRVPRQTLPSVVRHGIANVYRPGNQAQAVLVSLGIGVMFTLTVFLVQRGMLSQILESAPPNMPNVFLVNVTSRERAGVEELLKGKGELIPTLAARLTGVDGKPPKLPRFNQARAVTFTSSKRPQWETVQGQWWGSDTAPNQVCVLEDTARDLGIKPGVRMEWMVGIQPLQATVACLYRTEEVRMGGNMDFVFSPGTLNGLSIQYFAIMRMKPADVAPFQRMVFQRFPSVTVINAADVIEIIQQVVDQIAMVVRFISAFAILAGVIILASSIAATRFRRAKEVAILKTLGATRRRVSAIFSVEFLILGAAAGLLGGILATVFSNLLLTRLLEAKARIDWLPVVAAVLLTALIANAAGWLASFRILGQKPLEVLRNE